MERRFLPLQDIQLRSDEDGQMIIEGYPIVYERRTKIWDFYEVIKRGAARKALAQSKEFVLWNHNSDKPMASRAAGTLEVREDEKGVFIRADVSGTVWGREGYEAIKNNLITKMSFAFDIGQDNWRHEEADGVKIQVREIEEFASIYDYSPVTYPAYEDTELQARSRADAERTRPKSEPSEERETSPEVLSAQRKRAIELIELGGVYE